MRSLTAGASRPTLPYIQNRFNSAGLKDTRTGLGYFSMLLNYTLGSNNNFVTLTAGLKLNTASNTPALEEIPGLIDLQTGSGSTDYLLGVSYRHRMVNWIIQGQAAYRYNTPDKNSGLRFGDTWTCAVNIYWKVPYSRFTLTPFAGATVEHRMDDVRKHVITRNSGGSTALIATGFDLNTRKIAIGMNAHLPVIQSMAGGTIRESFRLNTHLFITL